MKPQTTLALVPVIFLVIGLGVLANSGFGWAHQHRFVAAASHAPGIVIGMERHYSRSSSRSSSSSGGTTWAPVVRFTAPDGEQHEFVSSAGSNPPSYHRGEVVDVLFEPGRPESAKINGWFSLWGGISIAGGLGSVFSLVGVIIILFRRRAGHRRSLLKTGRRVDAGFQSVEENTGLHVNGRSPFRVLCQWQDPQTSLVHVFASENLWYDPSAYIKTATFPVYIEPGNPQHYYVDISSLPRAA
jgi:hypothetical protein